MFISVQMHQNLREVLITKDKPLQVLHNDLLGIHMYGEETNLNTGADCSGFVKSVYKSFGYNLPRSSSSQRSAGRKVSYSNKQPGDLICYSGHIAIYIGNGKIVHASSRKTGIKISPKANYRKVLSVRRIVK